MDSGVLFLLRSWEPVELVEGVELFELVELFVLVEGVELVEGVTGAELFVLVKDVDLIVLVEGVTGAELANGVELVERVEGVFLICFTMPTPRMVSGTMLSSTAISCSNSLKNLNSALVLPDRLFCHFT